MEWVGFRPGGGVQWWGWIAGEKSKEWCTHLIPRLSVNPSRSRNVDLYELVGGCVKVFYFEWGSERTICCGLGGGM